MRSCFWWLCTLSLLMVSVATDSLGGFIIRDVKGGTARFEASSIGYTSVLTPEYIISLLTPPIEIQVRIICGCDCAPRRVRLLYASKTAPASDGGGCAKVRSSRCSTTPTTQVRQTTNPNISTDYSSHQGRLSSATPLTKRRPHPRTLSRGRCERNETRQSARPSPQLPPRKTWCSPFDSPLGLA